MQTYFISNGSAVKIGKTTDLKRRIKSLQTAQPVKLILLKVVDGDLEDYFHQLFSHTRLEGEWFSLACDFYLWLMCQTERNNWIGDFARDASNFISKSDPVPIHLVGNRHYRRILHELILRHNPYPCAEARLAFARAYREWMKLRRNSGLSTPFCGQYQVIDIVPLVRF